ncbi:MAG: hypothetical protein ACI91B_001087 [Planctomycetota bacterium]|jgi:hypothetical protein
MGTFLIITVPWVVVEIGEFIRRMSHSRWRIAIAATAILALAVTTCRYCKSCLEFRDSPTLSIQRVFDLGGLCSSPIAPLVRSRPQDLADLVLTRLRPTFIEFHGAFTLPVGLHDDPRFDADYVAIVDYLDRYASALAGKDVTSGAYVRREHAPTEEVLVRWRREYR